MGIPSAPFILPELGSESLWATWAGQLRRRGPECIRECPRRRLVMILTLPWIVLE
jgi:hypothetical protein